MTVGEELEHTRQRCGLSLQDVSAITKVSIERLEAIERGDVDALPPLVYLRGFVRSYASELGLDPDEVAGRYLAQFEQATALDEFETESAERTVPAVLDLQARPASPDANPAPSILDLTPRPAAPVRSDVPVVAAASAEAVSPSPRATPPGPTASASEDFDSFRPARRALATDESPPWRPAQFRPETLGRAAREHGAPPPQRLPARKVALAVAVAVLAGFVLSAQLDWFRTASSDGPEPRHAGRTDTAVSPSPRGDTMPAASSSSTSPGGGVEPVGEPARADAGAEADVVHKAGADLSMAPVDGAWALVNRIDGTSYPAFANLTLVYRVQFEQRGDRVTGTGQKWTENGRAIPPQARTPIAMEGTVDGRRLELRFTEKGRRRTTAGTLVMQLDDDGSMRGRFVSDAARSRGTSRATRLK